MKRTVCIAIATIAICLMSTASYGQTGSLKLVFHVLCLARIENGL